MKPIIIIQCRSSSNRLPGKALLPIQGIASVVLCAKRATNTGLTAQVVTSNENSDDELCKILEASKIPYFRGDINNVLKRFKEALDDVPENTPIVRLTADNLFVDGALIEELLIEFKKQKKNYLSLHPPTLTGTPYGLSAEVFLTSTLRDAYDNTQDPQDCEHVTSWMIRQYGLNNYSPKTLKANQAHLRCTMDTWFDYQTILDAFNAVDDPLTAHWQDLCDHLYTMGKSQGIDQHFTPHHTISELALGTAQIGSDYGISNKGGKLNIEKAAEIFQCAIAHGITHFDCAAAYGDAEKQLGQIITRDYHQSQTTIITKLSPLSLLSESDGYHNIKAQVEASVYRSCFALNRQTLPYLLLHRWQHRTSHNGYIWETLKNLQDNGVIEHLGASIQSPTEAFQAINDPDIKFIQLPFSLLDNRLQNPHFLEIAEARTDLIIQARSIFLQGLLVSPEKIWPPHIEINVKKIINQITVFSKKFNRQSIADLCIAYVRSKSWINSIVIGMESIKQLENNVALFQNAPLTASQSKEIESIFQNTSEKLLNPALWSDTKKT